MPIPVRRLRRWLFGVYGGLGAVVTFVCIGVVWLLQRGEDRMDPLADR